jgi:hypothetical protein
VNDLQYTHEKFWSGSKQLIGEGSLADRLVAAVMNHVCHAFDSHEFLPDNLRNRITDLRKAVNEVADDDHGSVAASVAAMTKHEVEHWAAEIFNISVHIAELVGHDRCAKGLPAN